MSSHLPSINKNATGRKDRKPEKASDLAYEQWKADLIYRIYGSQNPPTKTYRGRIV